MTNSHNLSSIHVCYTDMNDKNQLTAYIWAQIYEYL